MTVKPTGDDLWTVIIAAAVAIALASVLWVRTSRAPSPDAPAAPTGA